MFRRLFLIGGSLFLAGAMLCLMAEPSQAAQHGGHHGGGGHGGGYHGGGGPGGGYHGGGGHHSGGYYGGGGHHGGGYYGGYRGGYYGYRPFYGSYYGYPYYGYPYYSGYGWSSWSSPGYYYTTPFSNVPYEEVLPSYSSGYTPEMPPAADTAAHVTVRAPANARVWIGGWETPNTGSVREFDSPPLTPGKQYSYAVRAQWQENGRMVTQTQEVDVSAGARSEAVFPVVTPSTASQASGTAP